MKSIEQYQALLDAEYLASDDFTIKDPFSHYRNYQAAAAKRAIDEIIKTWGKFTAKALIITTVTQVLTNADVLSEKSSDVINLFVIWSQVIPPVFATFKGLQHTSIGLLITSNAKKTVKIGVKTAKFLTPRFVSDSFRNVIDSMEDGRSFHAFRIIRLPLAVWTSMTLVPLFAEDKNWDESTEFHQHVVSLGVFCGMLYHSYRQSKKITSC
jgi:hypothetical protein